MSGSRPAATAPDGGAVAALRRALGAQRVRTDAAALGEFGQDCTEAPPGRPAAVVVPADAAEVAALLRVATEHRLPVVPVVANWNVGGLSVPDHGGVVCDLRGMNRILDTDDANGNVTIEPGVTFAQLRAHLDGEHPGWRFAYPLAPPECSVLANCLLDGLTTLSLRHGTMGGWINALEVALPTGERVRTGGAAFGVPPVSHAPAPGLQGLFISAQGSTGIAVRGTLQLWHEPARAERWVCLTDTLERAYGLARELVALDCCDDIGVLTSAVARLVCGERDPVARHPAEPEGVVVAEIAAATDRQFRARWADFAERTARLRRRTTGACSRPLAIADLVALEPGFGALADLPARFDALLERGGLSWVGTYGPMRGLEVATRRALAVLAEHGLPPLVVMRPMQGGHFAVLRLIEVFDRDEPAQVARVRRANLALSDVLWDEGYVPYKTPPALLARHRARLDPGFVALWQRVRAVVDPAGICNPGRWAP